MNGRHVTGGNGLVHAITALALTLLPIFSMNAQDLIVRLNGDSVNCKIRATDKLGYKFDYLYGEKLQQAYILKDDTRSVIKGYYSMSYSGGKGVNVLRGYPYFRVSCHGGVGMWYSNLGGDPRKEVDRYRVGLGYGLIFGSEAYFMTSKRLGVGIYLSEFRVENESVLTVSTGLNGDSITGPWSDRIRLRYFGPSLYHRLPIGKKGFSWTVNGSFGVCSAMNNAVHMEPINYSGRTYGFRFSSGVDHWSKNGLGFGLSFTAQYAYLTTDLGIRDRVGGSFFSIVDDAPTDLSRSDVSFFVGFSW